MLIALEGNPCSKGWCRRARLRLKQVRAPGCDCYQLAKVNITCDTKEAVPYWTCEENTCLQVCGELPEEIQACICKPLTCLDGQTPVDIDNDGCEDTCVCGTLTCEKGLIPTDTNGDGCNDTCACDALKCDLSLEGFDTTGNGCPDTCACPGGLCPVRMVAPVKRPAIVTRPRSNRPFFRGLDAFHWACEKNSALPHVPQRPVR